MGLDGEALIVVAGVGLLAGGHAIVGQGLSQLFVTRSSGMDGRAVLCTLPTGASFLVVLVVRRSETQAGLVGVAVVGGNRQAACIQQVGTGSLDLLFQFWEILGLAGQSIEAE